jgi:hypothetical protein
MHTLFSFLFFAATVAAGLHEMPALTLFFAAGCFALALSAPDKPQTTNTPEK